MIKIIDIEDIEELPKWKAVLLIVALLIGGAAIIAFIGLSIFFIARIALIVLQLL